MKTSNPHFIVGIGGSAGGLAAYMAFLEALPANTGMAFVIVSHMYPASQSLLGALLARHTKMPVLMASLGMPIKPNHVYVCPPNTDLWIEDLAFALVSPRTINKQIDLFLTSLAEAMGARSVGIIFSGYDGDGTEGCRQIKANGGTTFAQDSSAEISSMPRSAQASGCVDFVLPPEKIPAELKKLRALAPKRNRSR
jgi:two-component system CheB/CheR fusion protein